MSSASGSEKERSEIDENYVPLDFKRSNILYTLKSHNPPRKFHSRCQSPNSIKNYVAQSPRIRKVVREVAEESSTSSESVQLEAQSILDEIAHKMALPAVRTLACFLRCVLRKVLKAVYVNLEGLELLSRTISEWPVVLLPSHRSYLDFILITYVLFEHNISLPCIAAGQDFMSMRGISPLLRRSGGFFLRRTFGSDKLYKAVFSEYVKAVLCSGDYPMEFFVEGTRSRSGKSLHPRLGLLSMVIEPYLEGRLPDIMMVPISISYERTLEELLFSRELLGVPKPKESTTALVRARTILGEDYGSIFVHIGKPISLHEVCQQHGISRVPHSLLPREMSVLLTEDWKIVKTLGSIILDRIQTGMKIFPASLIATALLQQPEGFQFDELVKLVQWIGMQVLMFGGQIAKLHKDYEAVVSSGLKMLSTVVYLSPDSNSVTLVIPSHLPHGGQPARPTSIDEVFATEIEPSDFSYLSEIALTHLHLAHYRNQLLHLFVEDAMVALCMATEIDHGTVSERFSALHCALAAEFVLPQKPSSQLLDEGFHRFLNRGVLCQRMSLGGKKLLVLQSSQYKHLNFLQRLVLPFVCVVWVVSHHLLSLGAGVQSLTATVKAAQFLSAKCLKQGILDCYEILSLGTIKNALASLHQAGLILQASNEFGTGKDRLVKVIKRQRLMNLAHVLGSMILPQFPSKL